MLDYSKLIYASLGGVLVLATIEAYRMYLVIKPIINNKPVEYSLLDTLAPGSFEMFVKYTGADNGSDPRYTFTGTTKHQPIITEHDGLEIGVSLEKLIEKQLEVRKGDDDVITGDIITKLNEYNATTASKP